MKFSEQIMTSKSDEYYTPDYAVKIILPYLKIRGFKHVWCPFDKEHSEFVKILKKEGFHVTFGHIETGQDFFEYKQPPTDVDCVVSNPPFSKRTAIFEALFSFGLPFRCLVYTVTDEIPNFSAISSAVPVKTTLPSIIKS